MGAVDLVVQIESPPSVASALQRVGRAGHQVGETSRGVLFPKHRGDLVPSAVTVERMRTGGIEALHVPASPLDVLAQQVVAATSMDTWHADALFDVVRRAASFTALPRSAYDATLDLLAGRYPSDEFAELRPRLVWDRVSGELTGRPGAQRLAVTSGGTIPDRGLFGVFLVGERQSRVGELDEEMVYESRVGDVFTLGTTSWRIEDITHDRVLVAPAPGQPGRLPFWTGDTLGRPAELGEAIGAFTREVSAMPREQAIARATAAGLDEWAADNLVSLMEEQREATNAVPHDQQLVVERFRDELGDWRLVVHSPFGTPVHSPWALAINARLRERYGMDAQAMATDDGIVLRIPETDQDPPGAELIAFEPDELEQIVTTEVGGSALFASRFRECAARALLLPRRDPGRRAPLWQQRQRVGAAARGRVALPLLPDRPRDRARGAPGRLRPAVARGPAPSHLGASAATGRRPDPAPLALRPVAALRLRRRLHVRGRLAPGRAPGRGPDPRPGPARRAPRPRGAARAPRSRGAGRGRGGAPATGRGPPGEGQRGHRRPAPPAGPALDRGDPGALHVTGPGRRLGLAAARDPPGLPGADVRPGALGRGRGRRPAPRRHRRAGAARRTRRVPGASRGPARRPGRPLRPHPRPVRPQRGGLPARSRGRRGPADADPTRCPGPRPRGRVPPGGRRRGVVRRRGAALAAPALARAAAPRGGAGRAGRAGAVPAVLAARLGRHRLDPGRPARRRRRGHGRRAAGRVRRARERAGVARPAGAGARLPPLDARRADGDRGGAVGGPRRAAGLRRVGVPASRRHRAAHPARPRRPRGLRRSTSPSSTRSTVAAPTSSASWPRPSAPPTTRRCPPRCGTSPGRGGSATTRSPRCVRSPGEAGGPTAHVGRHRGCAPPGRGSAGRRSARPRRTWRVVGPSSPSASRTRPNAPMPWPRACSNGTAW